MRAKILSVALIAASLHPAFAADADPAARERIAERFPGVTVDNIRPSPIKGLYEVTVGPIVVYTSADGRYMVRGDIHDLDTDENITEKRVAEARTETLAGLDNNDVIIFGKPDSRHVVTVFTDISCGYCREMHSKIEEYNKRGIQVRYAAFPRNGMASNVWQKMEGVWCAADRNHALTMAKLDREFESRQCETDKVGEQWQLGRMLGVRGTPAIFTANGQMIPGYLPPDELLKRLEAGAK